MKTKYGLFFGFAVLLTTAIFSFALAGCQTTTVPVTYTEPARLNLSGVKHIAVDADDAQVSTSISKNLTETSKYIVASAAELSEWKQWKAGRQAMEQRDGYQTQATVISAADLVRAYTANAVRSDSSYLRKTLRISAVVKEIGKSSRGSYFVRFVGTGNDSVDVYFDSSEINKVAAVNRGQTITIFGECLGLNPPNMEDTAEILRILGGGRAINITGATFLVDIVKKDYPGTVDAVIFLNNTSSVQDDSRSRTERVAVRDGNGKTVTDAEGKIVYQDQVVITYERRASVNLNYQIERTQDFSNIAQGTTSGSAQSSNQDRSKLSTGDNLVTSALRTAIAKFASEIVPTQRSSSITLAAESDNKEAKKEMSEAEKLVKEKNYADAVTAYGKIYAKYKNFAAGYNHAVLTEVVSGTETAIGLMEALSKETGNPIAQSTLSDMQRRNASNQRAAAQLSE